MKRFLTIAFLITISIHALCMPAKIQPIKVIIGGDTLTLYMHGDENCKYATSEDGYTVLADSTDWYYAIKDSSGIVSASRYKLLPKKQETIETKEFLKNVPQGLVPENVYTSSAKRSVGQSIQYSSQVPVVGNRKVLVVLMQFPDCKFQKTKSDFEELFNKENYNKDGAYGSVCDYYKKVSYGQLSLDCTVSGPYTAQHNMSFYGANIGSGGNDANPYTLFLEAVQNIQSVVNLKEYDGDADGVVDNIHIVYAGYGEEAGASSNAIWSHESTFGKVKIQDMYINRYSCSPELRGNSGNGITRIGAPCHEIGHALGAMDYYDTDYNTGGYYSGTGKWDIMASGSWNDDGARPADFNPYVKAYNFGWVDVKKLQVGKLNTINPSTEINNIYRVDTQEPDDYYLIENRQSEGITGAEPGKGMLIFHIGPNMKNLEKTNRINSTYPQQCYIVCASSKTQIPSVSESSYGNINTEGCPYPGSSGNSEFSYNSIPLACTVSRKVTDIKISEIKEMGNHVITLVYEKGNSKEDPDTPDIEDDDTCRLLWSEDFEEGTLNATWHQTAIEGTYAWEKFTDKNFSKNIPLAYSGQMFIGVGGYSGSITAPKRNIRDLESMGLTFKESTKGRLEFHVRRSATSSNLKDSIIVLYREHIGSKWTVLKRYEITNDNNWERKDVPLNFIPDSQIAFRAYTETGSYVFIDALKILQEPIVGDVDGDGVVSKKDADLVVRKYLGMEQMDTKDSSVFDVDRDGKITVNDANIIVNMYLYNK